ncbi:MAG: GlsB/YeaQ/YmgE family stress response membrane protein [Novosphingobium sp.]|nr:GlsB/YeaQ/YmgE family stress response membrane protein [Novosphingobium sp.]
MTFVLVLIMGGIIGWLASLLMNTDAQQGIFLNIVVGIVGALIAGVLITPLIGGAPITSGSFDLLSLFASFLGAVILLAVINLFRRGSMR